MKRIVTALLITVPLLAIPTLSMGQSYEWYINDGQGTVYWWEDITIGVDWEWMAPDAIEPGDVECTTADLPSGGSYYAATQPTDWDCTECEFYAIVYFDNNWPDFVEVVTATLGIGDAGLPGTFSPIAPPATANVATSGNIDCGVAVQFDFGLSPDCLLVNNSLILRISYVDLGGNTHVFWDGECCPSALYANCDTPVENETWGAIKTIFW